jgi:hypothetical protein
VVVAVSPGSLHQNLCVLPERFPLGSGRLSSLDLADRRAILAAPMNRLNCGDNLEVLVERAVEQTLRGRV